MKVKEEVWKKFRGDNPEDYEFQVHNPESHISGKGNITFSVDDLICIRHPKQGRTYDEPSDILCKKKSDRSSKWEKRGIHYRGKSYLDLTVDDIKRYEEIEMERSKSLWQSWRKDKT